MLVHAPDDIQLACSMKDDIRSTCLTQYDLSRQVWQCLVAPYRTGFHTMIIYANHITSNVLKNVIELGLNINSKDLVNGRTLPMTFRKFTENKWAYGIHSYLYPS